MRKSDKSLILLGLLLVAVVIIVLKVTPISAPGPKNQPTNTSQFTPSALTPPRSTLFFAGDIMLSRNVDDKIAKANNPNLPFEQTADEIQKADIAFANLESPFNDQGRHFIPNSLVFNADPKNVAGLNFAGFDLLSTANNHALDQGAKGINFTFDWLTTHGITPIGSGPNCHQGVIVEKNGTKFGWLAYSYTAINDGKTTPDPLVCDANDLTKLTADITLLKPRVDFVIVSMHMGSEYTRTPNAAQTKFAHLAIDSGADLIVGAHPHWIQTIEQYQGKWIFYSLGNFVFDQMWSQDTREGLTIKISVQNKMITKIQLLPVIIEDFSTPRWATDEESQTILGKLGLTSDVLMDNN